MTEPDKTNVFAERLDEILKTRGVSQAELARRTGLSKSTISHYVRGDWKGKQAAVYAIAAALHCRVEWLQGYDDWMEDVPSDESVQDLVERLLHGVGYYFNYDDFGSKIYMEKTKGGFVPHLLSNQGISGGRISLEDKQLLINKIVAMVEFEADKTLKKGIEFELRRKIEELDSLIAAAKRINNQEAYMHYLIQKDDTSQALVHFLEQTTN